MLVETRFVHITFTAVWTLTEDVLNAEVECGDFSEFALHAF